MINSICKRTVNTSPEELTIALHFLNGVKTRIKLETLRDLSKLVRSSSCVEIPPQRPVVGHDIFLIESGAITDWWKRLEKVSESLERYSVFLGLVVRESAKMILGKKSGLNSILNMVEKHGLQLNQDTAVDNSLAKVKEEAIENNRPLG